jgi:3D (Asp-Asp-Asp) domain-containing protein
VRPLNTALCLVAAIVLLAGCAPIHHAPAPTTTSEREPNTRPESPPPPPAQAPDVVEPPLSSSVPTPEPSATRVLVVEASAYNSHRGQTDRSPSIAAWGDRLSPGMKVIAVSKDLIGLGLDRGQRVRITGLEGEYLVMDRMPSRWHKKIDIYMGEDVGAAREWGIREVEISWEPEPEDLAADEAFEAAAETAAELD